MKMKTTLAMFAGFLAFGTASFAQIGDIDLSADGLVSFEELVAVYSEVTEEQFAEIDTNSDGSLDADEMNAAIEAGLLVMSE